MQHELAVEQKTTKTDRSIGRVVPGTTKEFRRARAWLDAQFAKAKKSGGFTVDDVELTPVLADVMLAANKLNRKLKPARVEVLGRAVSEGRWLPGASTIRFDTNQVMLDGQHRCEMVIAKQMPAIVDVRFGVSPEVRRVLDSHAKRTGGDILTLEGFQNGNKIAAAARLLLNYEKGSPGSNILMDNDVMYEFVKERPELMEAVKYGARINHAYQCSTAGPSVASYLIIKSGAPDDAIEIFFKKTIDGLGLTSKRDPIYLLRAFLLKKDYVGRAITYGSGAILSAMINAWNAYKDGRKVTNIINEPGEPFPTVDKWS